MKRPVVLDSNDLLGIWRSCRGYYRRPQDDSGQFRGPLVGYAGEYDATGGIKRHFVGHEYWNFAKVEEWPDPLRCFALALVASLDESAFDAIVGTPIGGYGLAQALGGILNCRVIKAEKRVVEAGVGGQREKSIMVLSRHEIEAGENLLIVEDVCNNFSSTDQLGEVVGANNGRITGIACALNRSSRRSYLLGDQELPVFSAIYRPTEQFRQDDPVVAADVDAGNVCWKPKVDWPKLEAAMAGHI